MVLVVSDASAFAADPEAKHVVRTALAEMASIDEELIVRLSMTVPMNTNSSTNDSTNFSTNAYGPNSSTNASTNFGTNAYGTNPSTNAYGTNFSTNAYGTNASTNDSTNAYGTNFSTNAYGTNASSTNDSTNAYSTDAGTNASSNMTVPMNGSRRLTAAPEADAVHISYVISLTSVSYRIVAALRNSSPDETARLFRLLVQEKGLPYAVNGVRLMTVSVSASPESEEEPCSDSAEGEGSLRGSRSRRNCRPGSLRRSDMKDSFGLVAGILLGVSLLVLALCVGVTVCVCRRMTKPREPKVWPEVIVITGAPCTGSAAKAAPSPAQGAVVDSNDKTDNNSNNDNNNNNGIVMGYIVPEAL
jgi:hypothetical protein